MMHKVSQFHYGARHGLNTRFGGLYINHERFRGISLMSRVLFVALCLINLDIV